MKKIKMFFGLLLLSAVMVGCGGGADSDIEIVNPFVGADHQNWQNLIDAFNATNPTYPLRNVSMEQDAMYTRIATAAATGVGVPELAVVHAERIAGFVALDMLRPLDDLTAPFPYINAANYIAGAWDIGAVGGARYGIPLDIHTWVMFYNRDLLNYFGVEWVLEDGIVTYDEIRQVGEIVNAAGGPATLGVTWMWPNFTSLYRQMGGNITDDGIRPTIYTPEGIAALELLHSLYMDGVTNLNGEDASQLFQIGQLLFIPEGIWYLNVATQIEGFEWGITHTPQYNPNNLVNWSSSHQFVLLASEERTPEQEQVIMEFIDWVRENSIEWARAGQNPAALEILNSAEFSQMPQSFLLATPQNQQSLVLFEYLYNGFVSDAINRIGFDSVFGAMDIRQALQSAQAEVEDRIAAGQ